MTSRKYDQSSIGTDVEFGKRGSRIKENGGAFEHKNQADNAFVPVRGAHPVGENDFVTKRYLETRSGASVIGGIDGGSPPSPSVAGQLRLCYVAGGSFNLNSLYRDTGAAFEEIVPFEGMTISITDAFGTYLADHVYMWNTDGTPGWVDIGPGASETKLMKTARLALVFGAPGTLPLVTVPANAVVTKVTVNVTQAWGSPLPSLTVGVAGTVDQLTADKDVDLNKVGTYIVELAYLYGSSTPIIATQSNNTATPATGAALLVIEYAIV